MINAWDKQIEAFVAACRRAAGYDLLRYSSGNLSCRLDADHVAVSGTGVWLCDIEPPQVAVCTLTDGRCVNNVAPTIEAAFHLGILRRRTDVNVVLHFQSPYATIIACAAEMPPRFDIIPEIPAYIGEIGVVDYLPPGSRELADAVVASAVDHDLVILRNHGLVVVGKDYRSVIAKAGFFELACRILILQQNPRFLADWPAGPPKRA